MQIRERDLAGVHRLWGEMAAFPASEWESSLAHLLSIS
jgi:hypothetical protein